MKRLEIRRMRGNVVELNVNMEREGGVFGEG